MPTYTRGDIISQTTFWSTYHKREQIEELVEQAKVANKELHKFMLDLTRNVKNESGKPIKYSRGPLKTRERIAEKCGITIWDDPSTDQTSGVKTPLEVKDIARATIVFSTIAQMMAFRNYIYTTPNYQNIKDKQSPAVKDLWTKGIDDQYKDVKFFLEVYIEFTGKVTNRPPEKRTIPHIVELQLNVAQMARGKSYGHAFYNLSRLAKINGSDRFVWNDPNCVITVPGAKKGNVGNKLRTAIVMCRSMALGDEKVLLATNILSKLLSNNLRLLDKRVTGKKVEHNVYENGTTPLVIRCGPYDPSTAANQDSGAAQAWAINHLSSFVWGNFTAFQRKPGVTGTAANWFAEH
ncbi:hypothetical protein C9I98_05515 [Photobacterium sanctipauli]|uniref:Uncharacterized protein n=2 Tax=Photobacterium sanctipauli TaxID=1342794 RepID=A0A2T3NYP1_9GAMM|nr:hypothetical protein [Photobacterium sanctipauli]PSW21394.1 hypothetical protein C9I98_05515 [Photobacterium sanctipauli]